MFLSSAGGSAYYNAISNSKASRHMSMLMGQGSPQTLRTSTAVQGPFSARRGLLRLCCGVRGKTWRSSRALRSSAAAARAHLRTTTVSLARRLCLAGRERLCVRRSARCATAARGRARRSCRAMRMPPAAARMPAARMATGMPAGAACILPLRASSAVGQRELHVAQAGVRHACRKLLERPQYQWCQRLANLRHAQQR